MEKNKNWNGGFDCAVRPPFYFFMMNNRPLDCQKANVTDNQRRKNAAGMPKECLLNK
jgi:hypothetical protein